MEQIININELDLSSLSYSQIDTIVSLKEAGGMSYDPDNNSLTLYGQINDLVLTKELIDAKTKELEDTKKLEDTQRRINNLCTSLTNRVKEYLTHKNVTPDQEERYKIKREAALKDDISAFTLEAELIGRDPAELMAYVKNLSIEWEQVANTALLKIDAFRVKINSILKTDTSGITIFILDYLESNSGTITPDIDVVELFNTLTDKFTVYLKEQEEAKLRIEEEVEDVVLSPENQDLINTLSPTVPSPLVTDTIDQEDLVYEEPNNQG